MEVLLDTKVTDNIQKGIAKGMSYQAFRALVKTLALEGKTTGKEQTEALVGYTKRWDKTLKIFDLDIQTIKNYKKSITWLVLAESWCGDAAHVLPVIHKVAELNKNITLKIVLRDENEALMNQFLTNGGKSIPKLIMIDNENGHVLNTFGPRPTEATQLVNEFKAAHGGLTPEFKASLQTWYNQDKGQGTLQDLIGLLAY